MPLPVSLNHVSVSATYYKNDGTFESGTVSFTRDVYLRSMSDDAIVLPGTSLATLNGSGSFVISLPVTDDAQWVPQGWTYTVNEQLSTGSRQYTIELPEADGDVDLADLAPVNDPSAGVQYVLLTSVGIPGGPAGPLTGSGKLPLSQLPISTNPITLTDATNIATDASLGNHFRVTLGGNRTLSNPTNPADGQRAVWEIIQDNSGSRTLAVGSAFAFGTDLTGITLTTTGNKRDFMGCIYNTTAAKWFVVAFIRGY